MSLAPGSKLGPYEVVAQIGSGGMGEVYRAKDPRLGRDVAIKVLPASFSADADRLRRFEQEARAAGILNHPNVTAVYDIGSHDGAPYVVSELLEGETLRAVLSGGRLSVRKAIEYAQQIAYGLAAAHEKGIVHRDLKPENLFVTKDSRLKILDFGLAKLTHTEEGGGQQTNMPTATAGTEPGVVMGTLGYMSPEQVRGRSADARSDLFSFGAILYEMLSGKRAFHGDSAADTMSAILREDPPELSLTNQNISPGLERMVRHCLEKSPEMRFQTARDLAFDLESLTGISGASASQAVGGARVSRRFPWLPAALAVAAAVGLAFWAGRRAGMTAGGSASRARPATYKRLTFRRGNLLSARFAPDGQSVVYSAAWDNRPAEFFVTRIGNPEARALGVSSANLLAVSPSGEMAIQLKKSSLLSPTSRGTLATMPLEGGSAREVLEDVYSADFGPDGKSLAVTRLTEGRRVLEYPIGKKIYDNPEGFRAARLSPSGDRFALLLDDGDLKKVAVVDLSGKKTDLTKSWVEIENPVWHPSGKEIWFAASDGKAGRAIYAVTLGGALRIVMPALDLLLHDISKDGRVLVERGVARSGILFHGPQDSGERELSWLGSADLSALSVDGDLILFSELGEPGGEKGSVYIRKTDGSPAVRLGEGHGGEVSPDGKWVLATVPSASGNQLRLLPTGAGQPHPLSSGNLIVYGGGFFPEGKRVVIAASEPGHSPAMYVFDLPDGKPRRIVPEGPSLSFGAAVSPDGKYVAVSEETTKNLYLYPVEDGEKRRVAVLESREIILQWSANGRFLYIARMGDIPTKLFRLEVATGKRELWKDLAPLDRAGLISIPSVVVARDGRSYAYAYRRALASDLFVIDGLK